MSVDLIGGEPPTPTFDVQPPIEPAITSASSRVVDGHHPAAVVPDGSPDTIDTLLLSVASGDQESFVTLQSRIAGLVRVNVRRVLRDATRAEAVTRKTFSDVLQDAISFDRNLGDAQTWLLTRAHQHAMDELGSRTMDQLQAIDATPDPIARIPPPPTELPA